ncbi:GtrA family protein [Zoogloea sp.]|uniref:GtrA family protein n=1 Tax=Zoogloea sp. TaxID=49181 RepID=UPI0035B31D72
MNHRSSFAQFVRFGVSGVVNTAVSYVTYVLLLQVGLNFAIANLISLVVGMAVSFYNQGRFVFGNGSLDRLPRFVLLWSVLYPINILLISVFMNMGFGAAVAGAIALVPMTLLSFFGQRHLVFHSVRK